jgi:competence protein ComEC
MWGILWGFVSATCISGWPYTVSLYASVAIAIGVCLIDYIQQSTHRFAVMWGWVLGLCYVYICLFVYEKQLFADDYRGKDVVVEGRISSLPRFQAPFCHFSLDSEVIASQPLHRRLSLYWLTPDGCVMQPGEQWHLVARLKPIRGVDTDGSVPQDYYARIAGTHAMGYVKSKTNPYRISSATWHYPFLRMQSTLWKQYQAVCPECVHGEVIAALLLGLSQEVSEETRGQFAETGISHLLAISGLHVGLMAQFASGLVRTLWSLLGVCLYRYPAPYAAQIGGVFCAFLYMMISGMGVPALRAVLMQGMRYMVSHSGSYFSLGQLLLSAATLTACYWPPLLWSRGFLLSYGAVACLAIGFYGRQHCRSWYYRYLHAQCVVTIGLYPITIAFWQQFSLYSLLLNIVAIPVFAFIIVPLTAILALVLAFPSLAHPLARFIDVLLSYSLYVVDWVRALPYSVIPCAPQSMGCYLIVCLMGCIALLPPGLYARYMLIPLGSLLPYSYQQAAMAPGELRVTVLDVGQGLAVWLQTANHHVLFDTGPGFMGGYSAGEQIIWPYMRYHGFHVIDTVIVSHPDLDHKGGLAALLTHATVQKGLSSAPGVFPPAIEQLCHAGMHWEYDGVAFQVLWPASDKHLSKNDRSCVLQVRAKDRTLLLTGDMEKRGEKQLLQQVASQQIAADVLIAPHHGSKGSSSVDFIAAVKPRQVIFATGANNRFHFPHLDTWKRYDCGHSRVCYDTARDGSIQLYTDGVSWNTQTNRAQHQMWWQWVNNHL